MTCVVIVGAAGCGKTTLSLALANEIGFSVVNVGRILEKQLEDRGVALVAKRSIGPAYMEEFGRDAYLELIARQAIDGNVIVDGLRIFDALPGLREATDVHVIYREPPSEACSNETKNDYVEDLPRFFEVAEIVVPWQTDVNELLDVARSLGASISAR